MKTYLLCGTSFYTAAKIAEFVFFMFFGGAAK